MIIAGVDEVGRGCLAGPVTAAAVILNNPVAGLKDSKKLSPKKRSELSKIILQNCIYSLGNVQNAEIDEINILNASFLAMHRAVDQLKKHPNLLLIDGNRFNKYKEIDHVCIIKGDAKFMPIAAASVLAKTYRDDIMKQYHEEFPVYDWHKNKGYPTRAHREGIRNHGTTDYHRMTFRLLPEQLSLDL